MRILLIIALCFITLLGYSQATQGTRITAPIVPNDSSDVYSTHDEGFGRGGYRAVKTIVERDAIKIALRKEGMLVKVLDDNKTYTLKNGIGNGNWEIFLNIDSINNLKVTQKLLVQALPAPYTVTFPFVVEDPDGYNRAAVSSKGLLITGRQHDPEVNIDALAMIGARNAVPGVDALAFGTNAKAVSDSSMSVGKNITNNRAGSVMFGYGGNTVNFGGDSVRVTGNWPFLRGSVFPYTKNLDSAIYWVAEKPGFRYIHLKARSVNADPEFGGELYSVMEVTNGYSIISNTYDGINDSDDGTAYVRTEHSNGIDLTATRNGLTSSMKLDYFSGFQYTSFDSSKFNDNSLVTKRWVLDRILPPSPGATWGAITGTLSNQTDLQNALNTKQTTLVSGTNIKSINGNSILGSGDLSISSSATWGAITGTLSSQTDLQNSLDAKQPSLVSGTNIKTINGLSILGSGDLLTDPNLTRKSAYSASGTNLTTSFDVIHSIQATEAGYYLLTYHFDIGCPAGGFSAASPISVYCRPELRSNPALDYSNADYHLLIYPITPASTPFYFGTAAVTTMIYIGASEYIDLKCNISASPGTGSIQAVYKYMTITKINNT
jgi:hypothetical protein